MVSKKTINAISDSLGIDFVPTPKETSNDVIDYEVDDSSNTAVAVTTSTPVVPSAQAVEVDVDMEEAEDSFTEARDNIRSVLETGQDAMETLLEIAKESEKSRDFEVLSGLMKTMVEASKELYGIHGERQTLKNPNGRRVSPMSNGITVDKAVFVGTSEDLLKQVKKSI